MNKYTLDSMLKSFALVNLPHLIIYVITKAEGDVFQNELKFNELKFNDTS